MYGDYLKALTKWSNDYLNVQFSAQVSYNMAMDMVSHHLGDNLGCKPLSDYNVLANKHTKRKWS